MVRRGHQSPRIKLCIAIDDPYQTALATRTNLGKLQEQLHIMIIVLDDCQLEKWAVGNTLSIDAGSMNIV